MRAIILMAALLLAGPLQAAKYALLVGVADYPGDKNDLQGPANDVRSLAISLSARWGFQPEKITTLIDQQATRKNILAALTDFQRSTQRGDHIFIYYSGHGTSREDRGWRLPLPYDSGAFAPFDLVPGMTREQEMATLLVGQRDLKPLYAALDQGGRQLFVVADSCYSGNLVRGGLRSVAGMPALRGRLWRHATRGAEPLGFDDGARPGPVPYPYRNVLFLSAASDRELAADIGVEDLAVYPTHDGKPHGAFTDALLRALNGELALDGNNDKRIDYGELSRAVSGFIAQRHYGQTPHILPSMAEDSQRLVSRALFETTTPPADAVSATPPVSLFRVKVIDTSPAVLEALRRIKGVEIVTQRPAMVVQRTASGYRLISGAGDLIADLTTDTPQAVAGRVAQELWVKRVSAQATSAAAFNMVLTLKNSALGRSLKSGERLALTLRADEPVHLLLLDVNVAGTISVLYPGHATELQALPANQVLNIPAPGVNDPITVIEPYGVDHLIAVGFADQPALLKEIMGTTITPGSVRFERLEQLLKEPARRYAFAAMDLITVP